MKIRPFILGLLLLAGVWGVTTSLSAQSLGALGKQEEERRKAIKGPSKVLTNQDLPTVPQPSETTASAGTEAPKADAQQGSDKAKTDGASAEAPAGEKDAAAAKPASDAPKDQAYWSGRMKTVQTQLERDQTFADALQTRINVLNADFANRDDPVQRTTIAGDRQKALDELTRLNKQIADDRKAIADLQEEARRASVPAGWLR